MTSPRTPHDAPEGDLGRRLETWLADVPDRPRPDLAGDAIQRVKAVPQRPSWRARWAWREGRSVTAGPLLAAIGLVLAVGLGAAALWARPGPAASPTPSPSSNASQPAPISSAPGPFDGRIIRVVTLERPAVAVGSAFGSLWVADDAGMLLRLDRSSGQEVAAIDLGVPGCGSIVEAAGSLWLSGCPAGADEDGLVTLRVDPVSNAVADRYTTGGGDGIGASAMNGIVWFVSDVTAGRLSGVDAVTGDLVAEVDLGLRVRHVTAGFGSLWVAPIGRPDVLRVDPDDGRVLATIRLSGDPSVLHTTGDAIWVAEPHQWLLGRIDPVADRVGVELGAAPGIDQLLTGPNGWIWGLADQEALAADPLQNLTVDQVAVPAHVAADGIALHVLAPGDGTMWFGDGVSLVEIALDGD